ncbi:ricin-type beta-trefoil lectin domain protein [Streptomyces flaveolus]|uniref:ricin-type beta-trefoil lectin domain protein n=1 Tax=Streptomyces flaveolus TaxID=67297 RepID=UPI003444A095
MRGVAAAVGGRRDAVGPAVRSDGGPGPAALRPPSPTLADAAPAPEETRRLPACVSHAPGLAGGTAAQAATCDGGAVQVWIAGRDGSLWVEGKCAMPAGKSGASGTALVLAACDGSSAQQWKAGSNGSLVNQASGLCAEVKGSSTAPGTALVTATCATATTGLSGRCLDATDASSANGTKLQIWTCGGSAQQKWSLPASV